MTHDVAGDGRDAVTLQAEGVVCDVDGRLGAEPLLAVGSPMREPGTRLLVGRHDWLGVGVELRVRSRRAPRQGGRKDRGTPVGLHG